MHWFHRFLVFAFVVLVPGCVHGQSVRRGVVYAQDDTGSYAADLYEPAPGPQAAASVVLLHGGSWRSGSRKEMRRVAVALSAHGYVCFAIDYDKHARSFPWSWQEGRSAIRFLRSHAAEYKLDPKRIAVLGSSAGGQIAALLALVPEGPAQRVGGATKDALPVQAAVMLNGGYDLHPNAWLLRRYLGGKCDEIAPVCDDASPNNHVASGEPPFFVGHGDRDPLIPYAQATTFIDALRTHGDSVTPFVADGGKHNYWKKRQFYQANLQAVLGFLDNALPGKETGAGTAS